MLVTHHRSVTLNKSPLSQSDQVCKYLNSSKSLRIKYAKLIARYVLFKATAASGPFERHLPCYDQRQRMHATEHLRLSERDCRQRGLSLPECLYAVHRMHRRTFEFQSWSGTEGLRPISGHDLVPRRRMGHWGRRFWILRTQISVGLWRRPRHR